MTAFFLHEAQVVQLCWNIEFCETTEKKRVVLMKSCVYRQITAQETL